jgi:endonuclease III
VFLRTGLAERDDVDHMVAVARVLRPDRPGELDNPAWDIGRRWCRPGVPDCQACPLVSVCPRYMDRGNRVRGI